jgi:hypothetical protein
LAVKRAERSCKSAIIEDRFTVKSAKGAQTPRRAPDR